MTTAAAPYKVRTHVGTKYDVENMVEKRIAQIVSYHRGSDLQLKFACLAAVLVVGSYNGSTSQIAEKTKRSVSSVENWAHAARLYKDVRSNGNRTRARILWREMPASHWWLAYGIQQAGYDALYYLTNAHAHNLSGRDMLKEWAQDREAGYAPLIFKRACLSFYGLAGELEKRNGELTKAQRQAVEAVRKAFAEA